MTVAVGLFARVKVVPPLGIGVIYGTAKRLGAPARRRIRLYLRRGGRLVDEVWSREGDGYYEFTRIQIIEQGYTVVEYDNPQESSPLNADIRDLVTPEPMP